MKKHFVSLKPNTRERDEAARSGVTDIRRNYNTRYDIVRYLYMNDFVKPCNFVLYDYYITHAIVPTHRNLVDLLLFH